MPRKKQSLNKVFHKRNSLRSEEELWLGIGLKRAKVPAVQYTPYLNQLYKVSRTIQSWMSCSWQHKSEKIPEKYLFLIKTHTPKAMAIVPMKRFPEKKRTPKAVSPVASLVEAPAPLSKAAQKVLEAKLVQHRFRLETPKQTIEVMVSGEDSAVLFSRIVSVISEAEKK
jgi:hypothetical protein